MAIYDKRSDILHKRILRISNKYHALSLLFYELSQSIKVQAERGTPFKKLKSQLKKLDIDKIIKYTSLNPILDLPLKEDAKK